MRSADIKEGDRVRVNHRGRRDTATVLRKEGRELVIEPDHPNRFTWRRITAKEVTDVIITVWNPSRAVFR